MSKVSYLATRVSSILNPPRRTPAQTRSRDTVDCVLQAATHVLRDGGLAAFNTNRVAQVAGVSVGSIYQYFPNKQALLTALDLRHSDHMLTGLNAAFDKAAGLPLEDQLKQLIDWMVDAHLEDPKVQQVIEGLEVRSENNPDLVKRQRAIHARLLGVLQSNRKRLVVTNLALAADMVAITCHQLVHAFICGPHRLCGTRAFKRELYLLMHRYLLHGKT